MNNTFFSRTRRTLKMDFKRLNSTPTLFIFLLISIIMPMLILVMTTSMGSGDSNASGQTAATFTSAWQAFGSLPGSSSSSMASMDMTSMCNINLIFFLMAVFGAMFVSEDYRSGYYKNIFSIRSKRADYVASKTIVIFISGTMMLLAYTVGAFLGGAISGLSFEMEGFNAFNLICCILSKIFFLLIFSSLSVLAGVFAKSKLWLSIIIMLGLGMLLFTMIPMITPLSSSIMNVILCLAGGVIFGIGIGAGSNLILKKISVA